MAIAEEIIGTHYRYDDYFVVGREKIREFAAAIKDDHPAHFDPQTAKELGHDDLVASLTFIAVAGRRVQLEMFKQFDVGINLARVIHRDQKLKFHRPIVVGDKLYFDSYLDSVTESHGAVIAELRSEVTDGDGLPVLTTVVTMLGEAVSEADTDAQVAAIASRIVGA
ncbi:MAG: MaoC family dehydratase N-terminal domain-containing protein [Mycobacterium sp.]